MNNGNFLEVPKRRADMYVCTYALQVTWLWKVIHISDDVIITSLIEKKAIGMSERDDDD